VATMRVTFRQCEKYTSFRLNCSRDACRNFARSWTSFLGQSDVYLASLFCGHLEPENSMMIHGVCQNIQHGQNDIFVCLKPKKKDWCGGSSPRGTSQPPSRLLAAEYIPRVAGFIRVGSAASSLRDSWLPGIFRVWQASSGLPTTKTTGVPTTVELGTQDCERTVELNFNRRVKNCSVMNPFNSKARSPN
jgi:hypothetical protein